MARANATVINTSDGLIGEYKDWSADSAPSGWLLCDASTVGSTASAANLNDDTTEKLYTHLWNNYSNTVCPVSTGRGASAAADFAANKTLGLPDLRGRVTAGKDDMGGGNANRLSGSGIANTTNGGSGGASTSTLSTAQLPSHNHGGGSHNHNILSGTNQNANGSQYFPPMATVFGYNRQTGSNNTTVIDFQGSGSAHQNTQPTFITNKIIKYL